MIASAIQRRKGEGVDTAVRATGRRRPSARRPDLRDQLGLRIGWVRVWLRVAAIGIGLWLTGASLLMWQPLQWAVPPFFYGGLLLMPAGALAAVLAWITPYPPEPSCPCPYCGTPTAVLRLSWRQPLTCPHCRRPLWLQAGQLTRRN